MPGKQATRAVVRKGPIAEGDAALVSDGMLVEGLDGDLYRVRLVPSEEWADGPRLAAVDQRVARRVGYAVLVFVSLIAAALIVKGVLWVLFR